MSFSVVILSKHATNLVPCVAAVRLQEPGARILVVDDGAREHLRELAIAGAVARDAARMTDAGVTWVEGVEPFVFARNANRGIRAAGTDDVVLLNDDALLKTPGGFTLLAVLAEKHAGVGLISAVTNLAGNPRQQPQGFAPTLRGEDRVVAFICVYLPRRTLDRVGELDERFIAYGWDDNDYCRRVLAAGLQLAICDGCFVDHASLHSTYRGAPTAPGDIGAGREIYRAKWGDTA